MGGKHVSVLQTSESGLHSNFRFLLKGGNLFQNNALVAMEIRQYTNITRICT